MSLAVCWVVVPSVVALCVRPRIAWQLRLAVAAGGAAAVLDMPATVRPLDALLRVDNLADLLQQLAALVAAAAITDLVLVIGCHRQGRRVVVWSLAGVLPAVLAVLFAASPIHGSLLDTRIYSDFETQFASIPSVAAIGMVYSAALAAAFTALTVAASGYARHAPTRLARASMLAIVGGAALTVAYAATFGSVVAFRAAGWSNPLTALHAQIVDDLVLALASAFALSFAITAAGRFAHFVWRYVALQRLRALWVRVAAGDDSIVLERPTLRADLLTLRDLDLRLYRRVIEICDGHRSLRPLSASEPAGAARDAAAGAVTLGRASLDAEVRRLLAQPRPWPSSGSTQARTALPPRSDLAVPAQAESAG